MPGSQRTLIRMRPALNEFDRQRRSSHESMGRHRRILRRSTEQPLAPIQNYMIDDSQFTEVDWERGHAAGHIYWRQRL